MHIALFQPDIPQNTGTILRLCACLGAAAHIIEPAGFPISDRHFRRAGMDYLDHVAITRHDSWQKFEQWRNEAGFRLQSVTNLSTSNNWTSVDGTAVTIGGKLYITNSATGGNKFYRLVFP